MNIDDYESRHFPVYEALATTVQFILKTAIASDPQLPRPQSIQARAKTVESLRKRLMEADKLESQTLEQDRRDLAGARIIFYTNNDVESFLGSAVIRDNFEVEEDSTKVHHPTPENAGVRYRGIHFTVRLRDDRLRLPEYARFAGLRCEIQVQTILNHAWSETSHDIIYKKHLGDGFGTKSVDGIKRRFERIMDKYLIPAGYEIQKAQQDYERMLRGKLLFDSDIVGLLQNAKNNNERYDILAGLKDHAIPHYDDLPAAYEQLQGPLFDVVRAAREDEVVPIETPFGNMDGVRAEAVAKLVVEIVDALRFQDAAGTLTLLFNIYIDEPNLRIRKEATEVVRRLAGYNIGVFKQVGPLLQLALIDHLDRMSASDIDRARPLALAVWSEALEPDITGQTWRADSMTLHTGEVPSSDQLTEVRTKAIHALFEAYNRSIDDAQRRHVLTALDGATRLPSHQECSNEFLIGVLRDTKSIVDFLTQHASSMSYELRQHLEHVHLRTYYWAKDIAEGSRGDIDCHKAAEALAVAILQLRDTLNTDQSFVRYKVLVGYESVYPEQWSDRSFDFKRADAYRRCEAIRYLDEIATDNEDEWFALISRCASTKSNDLATFPMFGDFLVQLAERKPDIARRWLTHAGPDLRGFLPAFLNGLFASGRHDLYAEALAKELESGDNLAGVAQHLHYSGAQDPTAARELLDRSIACKDSWAVTKCLLLAMQHWGTGKLIEPDTYVRDALNYLNDREDPSWVRHAWFAASRESVFYGAISPERAAQMLDSMGYLSKIDHQVEQVLLHLAKHHLEAVWDYFGKRLQHHDVDDGTAKDFEAVPFQLFVAGAELSRDPLLALSKAQSWFQHDPLLFRFRGGRLLSSVFPNDDTTFFYELAQLVRTGGEPEAKFAMAVLQNYRGEEFTHSVLKEIVSRYSEDHAVLSGVRACFESTGVVHGDLGFANAWRAKQILLASWQQDARHDVVTFAEQEFARLGRMIASEEQRAESDRQMRSLEYGEEGNAGDDGDA